jgi:3-oxoadipate enol-lactonase
MRLAASFDVPRGAPDAPVVVLGNSIGTTRAVWNPQLPALRERFRLLRFEYPGHGDLGMRPGAPDSSAGNTSRRLPVPPGPYTIADLGAGVLGLLDLHGIERAAYCGISLGGMVGMWLAAHAPHRITALGLCCTSAFLPPASGWTGRAAAVRADGMTAVSALAATRWFTPSFRNREPAMVAEVIAGLEAAEPEGYAGCCEAIAAMDLRPALASITAPALVIAGADDPATPPWHAAVIASAIPGARLLVVRGAAHLANIEAPGPVTAALLGRLSGSTVSVADRTGHPVLCTGGDFAATDITVVRPGTEQSGRPV